MRSREAPVPEGEKAPVREKGGLADEKRGGFCPHDSEKAPREGLWGGRSSKPTEGSKTLVLD